MKKNLLILFITITYIYVFLYKIIFIKYEVFQYIYNPLIWIGLLFFTYILFLKNNYPYYEFRNSILPIVIINSLLYVIFLFSLGFVFGYLNNPYSTSLSGIIINLFSVILIIVIKEIIRNIFLNESKNYNKIYFLIIFILFFISDLNIYEIIKIKFEIESIFIIFLKYIFPLLAVNLFSHYLVIKGGYLLSSSYRVITYILFIILPIVPKLDYVVESIFSVLFPLLAFIYIEYVLSKRNKFIPRDFKYNFSFKSWIVFFGIVILVIIFSLGGFDVKPVVVLSASMEPTLYPGDLLIINNCDISEVKVDDIIEFKEDNISVVHRVIKVKNTNNEIELNTKGDNNINEDKITTTYSNFMGCMSFKVMYAGYPTYLMYKVLRNSEGENNENKTKR